ncbi:hypothetical protein SDRG_12541 [Saprolegnia diclina VS20]|uniref:EF-hand domain-containing protein n=1 Tax=Saprolegnia diclina (strain VS20) TaxID=1156394 RepID=T0Q8G5_SAPDV|nr:hypothetical protein SDRG_12541 [Saprolegnia diclina VS20]EQC29770.1 hypothetical protein SDRG_12541 [Saprolegnia diclina VS20]|eukprot:XP_008616836.1 hypothetical protein SDRG_12541 [Saprolegnia diclina VS20]
MPALTRDVYIRIAPPGHRGRRINCNDCSVYTSSCDACVKKRKRAKHKAARQRKMIWDVDSLNPRWAIPPAIKTELPQLVLEKGGGVAPRDVFLQCSGLTLPPPPSETSFSTAKHLFLASNAAPTTGSVKPLGLGEINPLSDDERHNYFGATGRRVLKQIYTKMASQQYLQMGGTDGLVDKFKSMLASQSEPSPDPIGMFNAKEALTARHKFVSMCLEHELPPCLRLIIRNKISPEINVSHMSMGDELAKIFSACLVELPMVLSLNARNNRLTDPGLQALVNVVRSKPDLVALDLSENKVDGDAAEALAEYLGNPLCGLTTLILSTCDIDDGELIPFADAMKTNRICTTLNLSRNLIGTSEALNAVQPDLVTGGEALADMLAANNHLTKLDLSWNVLRLNSAIQLGRAIGHNFGLKELNLSYNAFGNLGAQAIGCALQENFTLEKLDLSQNNIPSKAAFVIAQALHVNNTLTQLCMDGNPLGRIGGRTLLQSISSASDKVLSISVVGCNFDIDDSSLFDPQDATGKYDLDMAEPYDRAIACELLRFANSKKGCRFLSFVHQVDKTTRDLKVEYQEVGRARAQLIRRSSSHMVLRGKVPQDKLEKLFQTLDADGSGNIEATELERGMAALGVRLQPGEATRLVTRYDVDGTGTMEFPEFVDLMSQYYFDDKPTMEWIDTTSGLPLSIPKEGRLKIDFIDLHIPSEADEAESKLGVEQLIENIKADPNQVNLIKLAKNGLHVRQNEGQMLLDTLVSKMDIVEALALILPHVVDPNHACPLIESNVNAAQRLRLQTVLKDMYGPVVGLATGHYSLDLADDIDRATFRKVMEINNKIMYYRRTNNFKDTSQHENHMGFRNEIYNNKKIEITTTFCDKLPKFGMLDFDFVQLSRPKSGILPMSDNRFQQLISKLCLDALDRASPESRRRAPSPATTGRRLSPFAYDFLLELQASTVRISELYSRDVSTPLVIPGAVVSPEAPRQISFTGRRLLMELQALFCTRWVTTSQVRFILERWPMDFGTTRVDAALTLFDRTLDLYNYVQVLWTLSDTEVAQLIFRLGWLNLWSPLYPDIYFELDLTIYEQREVSKVLVQLALDEPGENWQDARFGWSRDVPIPGWVLNMSWLTPGLYPEKGYLSVEYYSGADKGCGPVWPTRLKAMSEVLAEPPIFDAFLAQLVKPKRVSRKKTESDRKQTPDGLLTRRSNPSRDGSERATTPPSARLQTK